MTPIQEFFLMPLVGYMINLASGERSAAIAASRQAELDKEIRENDILRKALAIRHTIPDEIGRTCMELARNLERLEIPMHEKPLWDLLPDEGFQADIAEWIMAGGIEEGDAVKQRMFKRMHAALTTGGTPEEKSKDLAEAYFSSIEKAVFGHPILARWRHQLSLDYLRHQVAALRQRADESVGVYSNKKQTEALDSYCKKALASWDIIDLSNLPEGDIHITTQQLLLRRLYMPLRVKIEPRSPDGDLPESLDKKPNARESEWGWPDATTESDPKNDVRLPIGKQLGISRRLVVLGDPGGGKTTILRWMATIYLLRHNKDSASQGIPDSDTLPAEPWIPVLIRCRDLGEADLCRSFTDFLEQHLNKSDLLPADASVMRAVILDKIAKGEALLLIDGLDEITDQRIRIQFCQELERVAVRYPNAPIVVTSRIVGYRDMPYRMGSGFEHGIITELNRSDKDLFARRWIDVTEQHQAPQEKTRRIQELVEALHSSDRIERLTGNPMLLTTLALVKRKVGKLPNRRTKLYAEAVSVLLNWNPRFYETIEEEEAIPQLEYIAFEMCRMGVQRLNEDEILDLLETLRYEYPKIRAIKRRDPMAFLELLEQRSSILIRSGSIWQSDGANEKPVWEFRHLTFQEYLAARAILDGRYRNRGKPRSLAEQVAPLAAPVEKSLKRKKEEFDIPESWREALRLLVADCKDDDVDDVLMAIVNPLSDEDTQKTSRPRATLAVLCLADEPNVNESVAEFVFNKAIAQINGADGSGHLQTSLERSFVDAAKSLWLPRLKKIFIQEYKARHPILRGNVGAVWGLIEDLTSDATEANLAVRLKSLDENEATSAALTVVLKAYRGKIQDPQTLATILLDTLLKKEQSSRYAAAWALVWLSQGRPQEETNRPRFALSPAVVERLMDAFASTPAHEIRIQSSLAQLLGQSRDQRAVDVLLPALSAGESLVRGTAVDALALLGGERSIDALIGISSDPDVDVRKKVMDALGTLGGQKAVQTLLVHIDDSNVPVRVSAINSLGRCGGRETITPLLVKLDDQSPLARNAALKILSNYIESRVAESIAPLLNDVDSDVRNAAASLLIKSTGVIPTHTIMRQMETSKPMSHANIAAVLFAFREKFHLTQLLSSPDVDIRKEALRAYGLTRDRTDNMLLTRDFDARNPWIDPASFLVDDAFINAAVENIGITKEEVVARLKAMASEIPIKSPTAGQSHIPQ